MRQEVGRRKNVFCAKFRVVVFFSHWGAIKGLNKESEVVRFVFGAFYSDCGERMREEWV